MIEHARAAIRRLIARVDFRGARGASAVEYGIMIALIAAAIVVSVLYLGHATSRNFDCATPLLGPRDEIVKNVCERAPGPEHPRT